MTTNLRVELFSALKMKYRGRHALTLFPDLDLCKVLALPQTAGGLYGDTSVKLQFAETPRTRNFCGVRPIKSAGVGGAGKDGPDS